MYPLERVRPGVSNFQIKDNYFISCSFPPLTETITETTRDDSQEDDILDMLTCKEFNLSEEEVILKQIIEDMSEVNLILETFIYY